MRVLVKLPAEIDRPRILVGAIAENHKNGIKQVVILNNYNYIQIQIKIGRYDTSSIAIHNSGDVI